MRGAGWTLSALLLPLLFLLLGGGLSTTESGLRALARGVGFATGGQLVLSGVSGRLVGPIHIESLVYAAPDLRVEVRQLDVDWAPGALLSGRLHLHRLQAQGLVWSSVPSPDPVTPPADLTLPVAIAVDHLAVAQLDRAVWQAAPEASPLPPRFRLRAVEGRLTSDGRRHQFHGWRAQGDFGALALEGQLEGAAPPFPLAARVGLAGARDGRAYALEGTVAGTLLAPDIALTGHGAGLQGTGRILAAPFDPVPLQTLQAHLADVDPALFDPAWPTARLSLEATLRPDPAQPQVLAGPVTLTNLAPRPVDQGGLPVEHLAGRLRWSSSEWGVQALEGRLPGGGRIGGEGRWAPGGEGGAGQGQARLAVEGVDLRRLDTRLPATRLAGRLEGRGSLDDQAVEAKLADARFQFKLSAQRAGNVVALNALTLQAGAGVLQGAGRVDLGGEGAFEFTGQMGHFDPRVLLAHAPAADLNLDIASQGHVFGAPEGRLTFKLTPSRLAGQPLAGEGTLTLAAEHLAVPQLWLTLAGNRLEASGALGRPGEALSLRVEAPRLDALGGGYGGRLNLDGRVTGSLSSPGVSLAGAIQYLVVPGTARIGGANFQGEVASGPEGGVSLILGASRLGRPGVQADWLETVTVQLAGSRRAHEWVVLAASSGASERWRVALEGGLTGGGWQGRLREVSGEGPQAPRLEAPASLVWGPEGASLGAATLHVGEGVIHLAETRWSPAATVLRGHVRGLGFGLLATDGGPVGRGQATLRLGAEWDLRMTDRVEGQARLYRESGDLVLLGDVPARLGLDAFEVVLSAQASRLAASIAARGSQLGAFSATATALAEKGPEGWRLAPNGALLGAARLAMPSIAWLGPVIHPGLLTEGRLDAAFSLSGTPAHPVATGTVGGGQLGISLADLGLRLSGGTLAAAFDQEALRLTTLEFVTPNTVRPKDPRVAGAAQVGGGPGRLRVEGAVDLASGAGRFGFTATRLPILQRPDRWLMVSGEGVAQTGWDQLDLNARLKADAGFIGLADSGAPSLSDDVVILGRGEGARLTPFRFKLEATVDLGPRLYLSAQGVDTRLEGSLRLLGQDGRPLAVSGTVNAVGGVYEGYGQKLAIERGRVSFSGPLDNPGLNVVALRKGLAVEAGVSITGTARRPKVQLVSEPTVPDAEKLSWMVLGRAPDSAGGGDMGLLIPAAQALLGGPGGGMTAQLAGSLGLDQLSVGQGDLNSVTRGATSRVVGTGSAITAGSTVSGQVLSLGKRLSDEAFVTFEQSLGGAESIVKLTYQLSRRLSLIARGGTDNAVDLNYSFSFR